MSRLRLKRTRKPKIPKLQVSRRHWTAVGNIAIGDMLERVDRQLEPDGKPLKRNAPSTLARKRRRDAFPLSLVDTGKRFHRKSGYEIKRLPRGAGVIVAPRDKKVTGYVIKMGYNLIGMSREAWAAVRAVIRAALRESIKKARR